MALNLSTFDLYELAERYKLQVPEDEYSQITANNVMWDYDLTMDEAMQVCELAQKFFGCVIMQTTQKNRNDPPTVVEMEYSEDGTIYHKIGSKKKNKFMRANVVHINGAECPDTKVGITVRYIQN